MTNRLETEAEERTEICLAKWLQASGADEAALTRLGHMGPLNPRPFLIGAIAAAMTGADQE